MNKSSKFSCLFDSKNAHPKCETIILMNEASCDGDIISFEDILPNYLVLVTRIILFDGTDKVNGLFTCI